MLKLSKSMGSLPPPGENRVPMEVMSRPAVDKAAETALEIPWPLQAVIW